MDGHGLTAHLLGDIWAVPVLAHTQTCCEHARSHGSEGSCQTMRHFPIWLYFQTISGVAVPFPFPRARCEGAKGVPRHFKKAGVQD